MNATALPIILTAVGTLSMALAVFNERRMHRHRQPGVTYVQATFRRDGGWRRTDLFTVNGLHYQRLASRFAIIGIGLWVAALLILMLLD